MEILQRAPPSGPNPRPLVPLFPFSPRKHRRAFSITARLPARRRRPSPPPWPFLYVAILKPHLPRRRSLSLSLFSPFPLSLFPFHQYRWQIGRRRGCAGELDRGDIPWGTNLRWIHCLSVQLARENPRRPNQWRGRPWRMTPDLAVSSPPPRTHTPIPRARGRVLLRHRHLRFFKPPALTSSTCC